MVQEPQESQGLVWDLSRRVRALERKQQVYLGVALLLVAVILVGGALYLLLRKDSLPEDAEVTLINYIDYRRLDSDYSAYHVVEAKKMDEDAIEAYLEANDYGSTHPKAQADETWCARVDPPVYVGTRDARSGNNIPSAYFVLRRYSTTWEAETGGYQLCYGPISTTGWEDPHADRR